MPDELAESLGQAKTVVSNRWSELVKQHHYNLEVAPISPEVRQRHRELWELLVKALQSRQFQPYLAVVEQEGRLQARAGTRLEALLGQFNEIQNLIWAILSTTPALETNPKMLKDLTQTFNELRHSTSSTLLKSYLEETERVQQEHAQQTLVQQQQRLKQMDLPELIKNVSAFRVVRYQPGQVIFEPGDENSALYFIVQGKVRLYELLPDGRAVSLSLLADHDAFVQSQRRGSYFHNVYAEAMNHCVVANIRENALETMMQEAPLLAAQIIQSFSQQLSQSQSMIEGLLGRDVSLRLARLLLDLARQFGKPVSTGKVHIDLNLTHQELADMIGSNRVTITRKLLEFQKKQLIQIDRHTISITDHAALQQLVA